MASLNPQVVSACRAAASGFKIPLPTVIGIVRQESAGVYSARVNGQQEPVIRWEGHYFDQRLPGAKKTRARKLGLASPKAGGVKNPGGQAARWDRLLIPAMAIDDAAAIESVSWGLGQVMGAHWKRLGFASARALMEHARTGIGSQVDLMMRYCKEFGLIDELQRGDIEAFVRGYNGSGNVSAYSASIRKFIKAATIEFGTIAVTEKQVDGVPVNNLADAKSAVGMIRMGTKGARVREAQELLLRDGFAVEVDGEFGPSTKDAVKAFQKKHKIEISGMVDSETWEALNLRRLDPEETPGEVGPAEAVSRTAEGRQGTATALTAGSVTAAIDPAKDALYPVVGSGGWIDTIYTMLTIIGVLITLGGIAWIAYGWLKARRTTGVKVIE